MTRHPVVPLAVPVLPELDRILGPRVVTRLSDLAEASTDFGRLYRRRPLAVVRPAGPHQLAQVCRLAHDHGVPVVPRGAGHSTEGLCLAPGGIVVDTRHLSSVESYVDPRGEHLLSARAGARWRDVVGHTLPGGLIPPVLPDYLGLTVGGTLAAGGFSGATQHFGSQADTVRELEVVTPAGELVTCSAQTHPDLFDAVRGGSGRHGIITRAVLPLRRAPSRRLWLRLGHDSPEAALQSQFRALDGRFTHLEGMVRRTGDGWRFTTDALLDLDLDDELDLDVAAGELVSDLGGELDDVRVTPFPDWLFRFDAVEQQQRADGSWHRRHPRCTVVLPGRHAAAIVRRTLDGLSGSLLGAGGSILLYAFPTHRLEAPGVARAADPYSVLFGLQRTAPGGDREVLDAMRRANAELVATARRVGGSPYPRAAGPDD
ncbi:FAD-binding protein [Kineosporia succinea]|uniref:FAD/FMN-containing dehydrogenase n=1 Tax=Kineosporia succinea TaxID=84632 RepID=A0ABT9PAE1_9ACTN|nr:FAD-binding protein [Kineosporia succinea]MDP9829669.1 FAD/FMN-containing dehydrogenase [Kineosporia succinea]